MRSTEDREGVNVDEPMHAALPAPNPWRSSEGLARCAKAPRRGHEHSPPAVPGADAMFHRAAALAPARLPPGVLGTRRTSMFALFLAPSAATLRKELTLSEG